jgi:hypothetical protein
MIRIASATSSHVGSAWTGGLPGSGSPSTDIAITSSGSSTCVDPGFSASASLNALRITSGMIAGSPTRAFHFVIGRMSDGTSMYWCDSLCMRSRSP